MTNNPELSSPMDRLNAAWDAAEAKLIDVYSVLAPVAIWLTEDSKIASLESEARVALGFEKRNGRWRLCLIEIESNSKDRKITCIRDASLVVRQGYIVHLRSLRDALVRSNASQIERIEESVRSLEALIAQL